MLSHLLKIIQCSFLLIAGNGLTQSLKISPLPFEGNAIGILGMAQDEQGYVWMTDNGNGLYKYGVGVEEHYFPESENPNSPASGRIENILIDHQGIIWLPTFIDGLDRFDPVLKRFTHFQHDPQDTMTIRSNSVRDIVEDQAGNLWVGTNIGLDRFDRQNNVFIHHHTNDPEAKILDREHIRDLYVDGKGILWIGTGSAFEGEETTGGLFRFDPETGELDHFISSDDSNTLIDNRVRAIFEDSQDTFWVGTAGDGLHTMNRQSGTFTRHLSDLDDPTKLSRPPIGDNFAFGDDHITFFEEDDQGNIWIGTFEGGLSRYDPLSKKTTHFSSQQIGTQRIPHDNYWRALKTRDGLIWLASFAVNVQSHLLFTCNLDNDQIQLIPGDFTRCFCQADNGIVYAGTDVGVYMIEFGSKSPYLFKTNSPIYDLEMDNDGNLWAASYGDGLFRFNLQTKKLDRMEQGPYDGHHLSSNFVGSISKMSNGHIAIGTHEGVDIVHPSLEQKEFLPMGDTLNEFFHRGWHRGKQVFVDSRSDIWVGGWNGIHRYDRDQKQFVKYTLDLFPHVVRDIFEDAQQSLWIATNTHGLRKYDRQSDQFLATSDLSNNLLIHEHVGGVTEDQDGHLWLIQRFGLLRFNPINRQSTPFREEWGLSTDIAASSIYATKDGQILVGSENGYYKFDPQEISKARPNSSVPFVSDLKILNQSLRERSPLSSDQLLDQGEKLVLGHDQNDMTFELAYLDFKRIGHISTIVYQLENYDLTWRTAQNGDVVYYYQIPPGHYKFILKASDKYGNWQSSQLNIRIKAPWWNTWLAYIGYLFLSVFAGWRVHLYQKQRTIKRERDRIKDRELAQAREVEKAYQQLQQTQAQLIQSEKMASLGELTAGIAHEIQNPLNFVTNFSEVSAELISEAREELRHDAITDAEEILAALSQNLERINHHGERASSIVKGMLDHSRTSPGERVPTDINQLCDEYLRLAYHGMRAKDKAFNVKYETDFQRDIPPVNIVPQEIGRVILNLVNNAFQALQDYTPPKEVNTERSRGEAQATLTSSAQVTSKSSIKEGKVPNKQINESTDKPPIGLVIISTRQFGDKIVITISDNGPGIPEDIQDKIFQPFFTTKPSGQGTGLGLSLSYDIVKAHGGNISVAPSTDKGTIFTIQLPIVDISDQID